MIKRTLPLLMILLAGVGCGRSDRQEASDSDVLVEVGDSALTLSRVVARIPSGLPEEDSVNMYRSIVGSWVRGRVLSELGRTSLADMDHIEEMVADYRNELIVASYLASHEKASPDVSERSVKEYYEAHRKDLLLEAPIVKGLLLKVDDGDSNLDNLRRWMARATEASVDRIEKHGLRHATQYEYFMTRWMDWDRVAGQIPYRFYDAGAFLESTRDFETSYGGSTYLLHVSEYRGAGEEMPYEYAREHIRRILGANARRSDRARLMDKIYRKALDEGVLRPGLYNPITGETRAAGDTRR